MLDAARRRAVRVRKRQWGVPPELDAHAASLSADELREPAAAFRLVDEREVLFIELLEPVLPVDALERARAGVAGIVDAQDAGFVFGRLGAHDRGGETAARLDPTFDLVVVGGGLRRGRRRAATR